MPSSNPHTGHQAGSSRKRSAASDSRASTRARSDIITMLKTDHRNAKKAFREFGKLDENEDAEQCKALVTQACAELKLHAKLEEELFYPAARECLGDEALIDEAEVEHTTLEMLINDLDELEPGDDKYAATFTVLGEYVKHHISEEEGEVFPRLSHVKYDWQGLKDAMDERRAALAAELGIQAESPPQRGATKRDGSGKGADDNDDSDEGDDGDRDGDADDKELEVERAATQPPRQKGSKADKQ